MLAWPEMWELDLGLGRVGKELLALFSEYFPDPVCDCQANEDQIHVIPVPVECGMIKNW